MQCIHALVQTFVLCMLDYYNSPLTDVYFKRLQSVQNAAVRLVSAARRRDHITSVRTTFHWLPERKRMMFKMEKTAVKGILFQMLGTR